MQVKLNIILLPLLVLILINGVAYISYNENIILHNNANRNHFKTETEKYFNHISQAIKSKVEVARSLQTYFEGSRFVSRIDFKNYATVIFKTQPDILSLKWLPKTHHTKREVFEKSIRDEGYINFTIFDVSEGKTQIVEAQNKYYYPIKYYEPSESNKNKLLLNVAMLSQSSTAIKSLNSTQDEYAFSQPYQSINNKKKQQVILVYFPVVNNHIQLGMLEIALRVKDIFTVFPENMSSSFYLNIEINDVTAEENQLLALHNKIDRTHHLYQKRNAFMGGRMWQMEYSPSDMLISNYISQYSKSFLRYVIQGPIISLIVAGLLYFLLLQKSQAEIFAKELKSSQSRFETLLEKSCDAISLLDPYSGIIDCNQAALTMLGFESKKALMEHPAEISPKYQPDGQLSSVKSKAMDDLCLLTGSSQFEWVHQRKDGSLFWVDVLLTRLDFQGKKIIHITAHDITSLKKYEAQLQESEARLNQAQEIAHLGSWVFDINNKKLSLSKELCNILEVETDDCITIKDVIKKTHPKDRYLLVQSYQLSVLTKKPYNQDHRLVMKNGKIKHIRIWCTIEYDKADNPLSSMGSVMDITSEKKHEIQLMEARLEADIANQQKSKFLSNVSHELRTPMHGILSFSNFGIKKIETAPKEKLKQYFSYIQISGNRLLVLLNDLLDLSKLEAGKMSLAKKQVDLFEVFEHCRVEQQQRLIDLDLTIEINQSNSPLIGFFDRERMGQVITNLLSNAIKFSPESSIISVTIIKTDKNELCFTLQDQGVGIPETELVVVFDAFIQSSHTSSSAGGTGLGLAISQQIIMAHGGRIWAENNEKGGAKFIFMIPV